MEAWLSGEHEYCKIVIEPKLQKSLQGSGKYAKDILNILVTQIQKALGTSPTYWKWELDGDNINIGAAI